MRTGTTGGAVLLALLVAPAPAPCGERLHEVSAGESASAIAKRYYGDYAAAGLLLEYNGRTGALIREGERLRVPFSEVHRVVSGDTWSDLSRRYLGRASAYPGLAVLNGSAPEQPLRVGARIVIPVVVPHTLARGENLAGLAERYYGNASLADLLRSFNRIEDPRRLSVGQSVEVPVVSLLLMAEPEPPTPAVGENAPAPETPPEPEPEPPRFEDDLRVAAVAFSMGDYERARSLLESLRDPVTETGTEPERAELWRLLAFVYVAFDLGGQACDAYRAWSAVAGPVTLDPDRVSPRIRDALGDCGVARDRPGIGGA